MRKKGWNHLVKRNWYSKIENWRKKLLSLNKDDDYNSVSDPLSEVSDREKDQDYVPETPQRSSKRSLIKRKIVQQETEKNPKKQKTDFSIATKTQVHFDEEENVSISNKEDEEEADDEENLSDASDTIIVKEKKGKASFNKSYNGPKHFYPGHTFSYTISDESLTKNSLKLLNSILRRKKEHIIKNINKILNGKQFVIEKNRMFLPCPFENCFFQGDKLFRHLQSRHHQMGKEKSGLFQSYVIRYIDYYSLVFKSGMHPPQICIKCNRFYLRIDSHIEYTQQLKRNSNEFKHAISKSHRHTPSSLLWTI